MEEIRKRKPFSIEDMAKRAGIPSGRATERMDRLANPYGEVGSPPVPHTTAPPPSPNYNLNMADRVRYEEMAKELRELGYEGSLPMDLGGIEAKLEYERLKKRLMGMGYQGAIPLS